MSEIRQYILFILQECRFETRSLLLPVEKITEEDLQLLRNSCDYDFIFYKKDDEFIIEQLVIVDYDYEYDFPEGWVQKRTAYSQILREISRLSDFGTNPLCGFAGGFDPIQSYIQARNMKQFKGENIEIVEGFLILEAHEGDIQFPGSKYDYI